MDVTTAHDGIITCRTFADLARGRDRYECTLDNYPPSDDPIAMAQTVVQYMEGTFISFAAINISGISLKNLVLDKPRFCNSPVYIPESNNYCISQYIQFVCIVTFLSVFMYT